LFRQFFPSRTFQEGFLLIRISKKNILYSHRTNLKPFENIYGIVIHSKMEYSLVGHNRHLFKKNSGFISWGELQAQRFYLNAEKSKALPRNDTPPQLIRTDNESPFTVNYAREYFKKNKIPKNSG